MGQNLLRVLVIVAMATTLAGCARPRLAARPLTSEERFWGEAIQGWYPGWRAPYLAPSRPALDGAATESAPAADAEPVPSGDGTGRR